MFNHSKSRRMNRKNQNKRREFLNNVCPTVALAFMGVTMLEACSSGGDDSDMGGGNNNGGGGNNNLTGGSGNDVFQLTASSRRDLITDYNSVEDNIQLLGGISVTLQSAGNDTNINFNGDLLAIIENTNPEDLNFI